MSQASIDQFKSQLAGGGVRPTMFQVELAFPDGTMSEAEDLTVQKGIFLIKAAALPPSNIGTIEVPFRGRKLKVSGDRSFDPWEVTIINDIDFSLRTVFEKWSEIIQNMNYALGANNLDRYFQTAIVRQLDRDGNVLRSYQMHGVWPQAVAEIGLDFDSTDTIEEYGVTFNVQYWTAAPGADDADPTNTPGVASSPLVVNS